MPAYCYICDSCGRRGERVCASAHRNRPMPCECGNVMGRDIQAQFCSSKERAATAWPQYCEQLGVHPSQIPEAIAADKAMGLKTKYTPDGRMEFGSAAEVRRFCKLSGYRGNL